MIRQLTFQLGQVPSVLTQRTLPAKASAPLHPLSRRPLANHVAHAGGVIAEEADPQNLSTVFLTSQEGERRFLSGFSAGGSAPEKL